MDQIKVYLNLAVKYRFWITMGIAAILPMIAYFVGSGPVKKAASDKESLIKSASEGVKPYASGSVINAQYTPLLEEKTEALSGDVTKSWEKLYERQKSLLTWPEVVESRFHEWGNKWPEGVDAQSVQQAINDYVIAYPDQVTSIYSTFKPFDPESGEGIVSAPPKETLLRPAPFDVNKLPELGKVWGAQERLWIQRALLDVVRKVNDDAQAKDWDGAIIKQINLVDVGDQLSQDQISIADGQVLAEAPELKPVSAGGEEVAAEEVVEEPTMGGRGMQEMMMGGGMGGFGAPTESVYYITTESTQFKVMPVKISVLIDQTRIPEFLIALENSPMAIEVRDFEMSKPSTRVEKPVKGVMGSFGFGGGYMGGMEGMMGMGMMGREGMGMPGGMGMSMRGQQGMGMPGGMGMMGREGMGMGMGMGGPVNKGVDKRSENRKTKRETEEKALAKVTVRTIHDPYYNIVEVVVYGQARFYNPPTKPEAAPSDSAAETPAEGEAAAPAVIDPGAPAVDPAPAVTDPAKPAEEPKAETPAPTEEPKAETPAAIPAEEPKAETPAVTPTEPAKGDEPKAEPAPK
ncbi:hypothetical protein EP7_004644 [Isosphaeraceae bacterium EP7]